MNEINGLPPEETFLAENQLNKYEIDAKVDTEAIKGSADRIMKVITKCECYDKIVPAYVCEKHLKEEVNMPAHQSGGEIVDEEVIEAPEEIGDDTENYRESLE